MVASRDGRTVLFVSHNAAAMRTLCTHGILMTGGKASPKQDIVSTLDLYSLTNQLATSSTTWTRPVGADARNVRFETIDISIQGTQPRIRLRCTTEIKFENSGRRVAIAIDLHAGNSVVIIQAIPYEQPFIGGESGTYIVEVCIELPPLVPGVYGLDFWLGPHNTETFDFVKRAVTFEILDSPNPGRSFPHTPDHGYISAVASAEVRLVATAPSDKVSVV